MPSLQCVSRQSSVHRLHTQRHCFAHQKLQHRARRCHARSPNCRAVALLPFWQGRKQAPDAVTEVVTGTVEAFGYTVPLHYQIIIRYGVEALLALAVPTIAAHVIAWQADRMAEKGWEEELELGQLPLRGLRGGVKGAAAILMQAASKPGVALLPWVGAAYAVRSLIQGLAALSAHKKEILPLIPDQLEASMNYVVDMLLKCDAGLYRIASATLIMLAVWMVLRVKRDVVNQMVAQRAMHSTSMHAVKELTRVVLPISNILSWVIGIAGALLSLEVWGVDVKPLLTLGGVSGVIIGLSAQAVFANTISGINLFLSRAFVPGDRIEVFTPFGMRLVQGIIERTDPMRTIIRNDNHIPITVPNKVLADHVIANESQVQRSSYEQYSGGRSLALTVRIKDPHDYDLLETMMVQMQQLLDNSAMVDKRLQPLASVSELDRDTITVQIQATTKPNINFQAFRQKLLLDIGRLLQKMDFNFEVSPPVAGARPVPPAALARS